MSRAAVALAKTLLFTLLVPATVAGWVPWWLRGRTNIISVHSAQSWLALAVVSAGVAIYLYTAFWSFAWVGGGTPAPVAPTETLVITGLHRFVRNPMYLGVGLVIAAQAWLFRSAATAIYLGFYALAVHLFVVFYEEPSLRRRFGARYERYRDAVPRWIPKFRL